MSVIKANRQESPFEVMHNYDKMVRDIVDLLLRDFGFSADKATKALQRRIAQKPLEEYTDEQMKHFEKTAARIDSFDEWFIASTRERIFDCLMSIGDNLMYANNIYPTCPEESTERRIHQERAIALLYRLTQLIQTAVEILPTKKDAAFQAAGRISHEIDLIRGWRKYDNRQRGSFHLDEKGFYIPKGDKTKKERGDMKAGDGKKTRSV